jgi:predicted RNase H-like nuclease (RuvC/YqgF family)
MVTKNSEFQKELQEIIKPGVKASDLKKLKHSKSADNLPISVPSIPLKKSQSQLEIPVTQQPSSEEQIKQLKEQVKFQAQTSQNYLISLQLAQSKITELEEKEKKDKQEIEELTDYILELRLENIQDFGKYREQLKAIQQQLDDTVDQASDELVKEDDKNSQLRTKLLTARQQISSLQKDLNLAEKLAEMRKYPLPNPESDESYLKYIFGGLALVFLGL